MTFEDLIFLSENKQAFMINHNSVFQRPQNGHHKEVYRALPQSLFGLKFSFSTGHGGHNLFYIHIIFEMNTFVFYAFALHNGVA